MALHRAQEILLALSHDVHVMVIVLVLLLVLILENDLLFSIVYSWLEYLVGPLVLAPPVVVLILVLKVVVPDIRVSITNADIDAFVLQHPGYFPEHLLGVLLGVGSALDRPNKYKHGVKEALINDTVKGLILVISHTPDISIMI